MAKLHIICGNCGCSDMFTHEVDCEVVDDDINITSHIKCRNCSTIHDLEDNASCLKTVTRRSD